MLSTHPRNVRRPVLRNVAQSVPPAPLHAHHNHYSQLIHSPLFHSPKTEMAAYPKRDITFAKQVDSYYKTGNYSYGKSLGEMGEEISFQVQDSDLQKFALAAYKHDPEVAGYAFVPALSTYDSKVWVKPGSKVAVVAFKGTEPSHLRDLYTDLRLSQGTLGDTARAESSYATLRNVHNELPGYRIMVTGHSLGGSLAREVSNEPYVTKAVGFNTGYAVAPTTLATNAYDFVKRTKSFHEDVHRDHPKFSDYLNMRDPISIGSVINSETGHTYYKKGWGLKAHKPTYFP